MMGRYIVSNSGSIAYVIPRHFTGSSSYKLYHRKDVQGPTMQAIWPSTGQSQQIGLYVGRETKVFLMSKGSVHSYKLPKSYTGNTELLLYPSAHMSPVCNECPVIWLIFFHHSTIDQFCYRSFTSRVHCQEIQANARRLLYIYSLWKRVHTIGGSTLYIPWWALIDISLSRDKSLEQPDV